MQNFLIKKIHLGPKKKIHSQHARFVYIPCKKRVFT